MIKTFIKGGLRCNEDKSCLEHMAPVLSFSLENGSYYENEYSYLSRVNERKYNVEDWKGYPGKILCQDNEASEVYEYDFEKKDIGGERVFPGGIDFFADWYTVQIDAGMRKVPPISISKTEIRNRLNDKVICIDDSFQLSYVIGEYLYGGIGLWDGSYCAVKIDGDTGETLWQNFEIRNCGELLDDQRFLLHDLGSEDLKLYSLETGGLLKTISLPSPAPGPFQYGTVRRYLSPEGLVFDYDSSTDQVQEYQLFDNGAEEGSDFTRTEEFVCATNAAEHRLRVYSIPKRKCVFEGYLPEIGVGLGTSPVAKLGDYYSFTINDRSRWNHGFYTRTYLFALDDLKKDFPQYEHEELKADYERVSREDGNVDYRVFFSDTESYSVLYRHANAIVNSLGEEYGWTKAFEGNSCDEQFTGKITVDVSNQALGDEQKNYLELLCTYLTNELQLFYRAGMDPEQLITVMPQFD